MIKGVTKSNYNEFELEMLEILGFPNKYGIKYYFELLQNTYSRATKYLELEANNFHKSNEGETLDNKHSILQSGEFLAYPYIETLWESYFITIHSELDIIWNETILLFNNIYQQEIKRPKINSNYFKLLSNIQFEQSNFLDTAITQHQILFTYNYIRNGIIHPKKDNTSEEYQVLKKFIENQELNKIEIIETDKGFSLSIKDLSFCEIYSKEVLNFVETIIKESFKQRQHII